MDPRGICVWARTLALAGVIVSACLGLLVAERAKAEDRVSPIRQITRPRGGPPHFDVGHRVTGFRSIDGSENNPLIPDLNAADTPLSRLMEPDYVDGVSAPAGADRPSPRVISNEVAFQARDKRTPLATSDFLWQWGQFLDHDLDLTDGTDPPEAFPIPVPAGDPDFDPGSDGGVEIPFNRSLYDPATGTHAGNPREQVNEITGWIDASNVYGSGPERATALRAGDGSGRLRTSPGDLLPLDEGTLPNATGGSQEQMFLAGDVRANEQVALTAMHTLFVREHNRIADKLHARKPWLSGEEVYQRARRWVGAEMQVVTYREFLPALLGRSLPAYRGYDPEVDATVSNEFATAAYRFGHSALSPRLRRLDRRLRPISGGPLALRDAFFSPDRIRTEGGIDPLLRGLAHQVHQAVDVEVIDDVRNFLFGPPGAGGFDLAALNLQRGRDHGLASYNDTREAYGRPRARGFSDISDRPEVQRRLAEAYASVDDVDLWVGGLAEDPRGRSHVGPLFAQIIQDQFRRLRDGDRYWYQRTLSPRQQRVVERTRLSDIIRRNTGIRGEIPRDVFRVSRTARRQDLEQIRGRGRGPREPADPRADRP